MQQIAGGHKSIHNLWYHCNHNENIAWLVMRQHRAFDGIFVREANSTGEKKIDIEFENACNLFDKIVN